MTRGIRVRRGRGETTAKRGPAKGGGKGKKMDSGSRPDPRVVDFGRNDKWSVFLRRRIFSADITGSQRSLG